MKDKEGQAELLPPEIKPSQLPATTHPARPMDIKDGVSLLPVEQQKVVLAQYTERRSHFRHWLLSQLQEGVHYGYPPGCKPRPTDAKQWQAKPSLYKAGAAYLVDLLQLRTAYESDEAAWKMMGAKPGMICRTCRLFNPQTNEILGQGTGAFVVGQKEMDSNGAIKMADKRALVAAVINTIAVCADLFTQDIEDKPIKVITPERSETLKAMIAASGTDASLVAQTYGVQKIEDIAAINFEAARAMLNRKLDQVLAKRGGK